MDGMKRQDDIRMDQFEANLKELGGDVKTIMTNHLPHFQISLTKIESNMDWLVRFFWLFAASFLANIAGLIVNII